MVPEAVDGRAGGGDPGVRGVEAAVRAGGGARGSGRAVGAARIVACSRLRPAAEPGQLDDLDNLVGNLCRRAAML